NSVAISITNACRLRSAVGRQDSDARQGRTQRDVVFTEDSRWLAAEDACNLYTDAIHLGHVSRPRRLLRIARLRVRARRCARPREFRWRLRAVCKRTARRTRRRRVAGNATVLQRETPCVGRV